MQLRAFLMGIFCFLLSFSVFAAEGPAAGQVIVSSGPFQAIQADTSRALKRGDSFYSGDTLVTGTNSNAQIRFSDGTVLAMTPNSRIKIDDYVFTKSASSDKSIITLIKGGFRALTGLISKENPAAYKVQTSVAVIGVRGTNYGVTLDKGKLYAGVWKGNIVLQNDKGLIQLGQGNDYSFAEVGMGQAPVGLLNPPPQLSGQCKLS